MASDPLRHADLPGVRPLYADLLGDYPSVRSYYAHEPSVDGALHAASQVRLDPQHRRSLVDALSEQNDSGDPSTAASLDLLSSPNTVAVVTGQQVGLYGGPVFTLYKALTAVRWAEELTRLGTPAVPVFWLATEDHDLVEIDHCWVFGRTRRPVCLTAESAGPENAAVGAIRIAEARLGGLDDLFATMPAGAEALSLARSTYDGAPFYGDAFRSLYTTLLRGTGTLFLCPTEGTIRSLTVPLLRQVIEEAPTLTDDLMERGTSLDRAGYHQQVHFQSSSSVVMLFEDQARVALKRRNGMYWSASRSYSRGELLQRLESEPNAVTPNALLRPVMQDYLLPTAALVAGPSEAAYLGQSSVLYDRLLGRMPTVLPRASFTVLDHGARKLLGKYGLEWTDCIASRAATEQAIGERAVPADLRQILRTDHNVIDTAMEGIHDALQDFDPTLASAFNASRRKIDYQISKIESKVAREALRRADRGQEHAGRLADWIYPNDTLQERVFGTLPFIAQFGLEFVDRVREAINPGSAEHTVLEL